MENSVIFMDDSTIKFKIMVEGNARGIVTINKTTTIRCVYDKSGDQWRLEFKSWCLTTGNSEGSSCNFKDEPVETIEMIFEAMRKLAGKGDLKID